MPWKERYQNREEGRGLARGRVEVGPLRGGPLCQGPRGVEALPQGLLGKRVRADGAAAAKVQRPEHQACLRTAGGPVCLNLEGGERNGGLGQERGQTT